MSRKRKQPEYSHEGWNYWTIEQLKRYFEEYCRENPFYIEKRSRRVQLLMQPTLYEKIRLRAIKEETSVNDVINNVLIDEFC